MKKIALFGSDFSSLSQRAELDPFWVLNVKRLQNAFFFNSFPLSSAGACLLAPFWSLPFCFFLLCLACFPPSGLRACWLARFWLSLACAVLSGSLNAASWLCYSGRTYLLGWASLAVPCLRCPVWLVSCRLWFVPAGSGVSGCCLPALSCLARFRGRLRFLPAWLGVSGCYLPALSSLARFLPSLVCTCLVGCFWLLPTCSALSGSFPAVCGSYLLGWAFLAVNLPCVVLSGSFPAVSGLHLLGCVFLAVCRSMAALSWFLWFLRRCFSSRKLTSGHINA